MKIYMVQHVYFNSDAGYDDYIHVAFLDSMEKAEKRIIDLKEKYILDSYIEDLFCEFHNNWVALYGKDISSIPFPYKDLPSKPKFPQGIDQNIAQKIHLQALEAWRISTKEVQEQHKLKDSVIRGNDQYESLRVATDVHRDYLKNTVKFSDISQDFLDKFIKDSYSYKSPEYIILEEELE